MHNHEEDSMTVETTTAFSVATFKRAYEEWDIEALLELYADGIELVQIDRDHPPSARRVRHGRDVLGGMFEHCAGAGVVASVENTVADDRRAAATITCEFPDGRKVLANAILELEGGRIVRELDVLSGDPRGT
jgi:SnoaL-like protein